MSETESCCNEGIASVVTDTTRDSDEKFTPKILSGLHGLGQKKPDSVATPKWKSKVALSASSTVASSPVIPFQQTKKLNLQEVSSSVKQPSRDEEPETSKVTEDMCPQESGPLIPLLSSTQKSSVTQKTNSGQPVGNSQEVGNSQKDSCSEVQSPSLLPQTDRWTESFSLIPSFVKRREEKVESQSQSLLPQTDRWTEKFTFQPNFITTCTHQTATQWTCKHLQGIGDTTVGSGKQYCDATKKKRTPKKKTCTHQTATQWTCKHLQGIGDTTVGSGKQYCDATKKKRTPKKKTLSISNSSEVTPKKKAPQNSAKVKKQRNKKPTCLAIPSQCTVLSADEIDDVTVKISDRIEKQLADLEKAPRKKMLVIEAALVHCVTSVQGNIDSKLDKLKSSFRRENADILRKLLQTLKMTLGRLIEHHKQEREQFATSVRDSQLTQEETFTQKTLLLELGKRQKDVFSLFTKQRELASKLKEIEITDRSAVGKSENVKFKTCAKPTKTIEKERTVKAWSEDKLVQDKIDAERNVTNGREIVKYETDKMEKEDKIIDELPLSQSGSGKSHFSQESDSGLLDVLKILRNRRQGSVYNTSNNSQQSSANALANQDSLKDDSFKDDITHGSSTTIGKFDAGNEMEHNINSVGEQDATDKKAELEIDGYVIITNKQTNSEEQLPKEKHDKEVRKPCNIETTMVNVKPSSIETVKDMDNNHIPSTLEEAVEMVRGLKKDGKVLKGPQVRNEPECLDRIYCVTDKENDVILSKDVTTIPDTQEHGTQETFAREAAVIETAKTSTAETGTTGNKKRQTSSSEDHVPRRKKYTKMQENADRESCRTDCSPKTKDEAFQETTGTNQRTAAVMINKPEHISLKQFVNVVPLNNFSSKPLTDSTTDLESNVMSSFKPCQTLSGRSLYSQLFSSSNVQNKLLFQTSGEPLPSQTIEKVNSSDPKLSKKLWMNMMRNETVFNKPTRKGSAVFPDNCKQNDNKVSLKSPGDKLNQVIKRITEEKENVFQDKENLNSNLKTLSNESTRSETSVLGKNVQDNKMQQSKNRDKNNFDVNIDNLYEAGLAVELPQLKDKSKQVVQTCSETLKIPPNHDYALLSTPRVPPQDETNIMSPTATSMSSDVFFVKAKELQKRMKSRAEMSQKLSHQFKDSTIYPYQSAFSKSVPQSKREGNKTKTVKTFVPQNLYEGSMPKPARNIQPIKCPRTIHPTSQIEKMSKTKTSEEKLEAVINNVIKSSAAFSYDKDPFLTQGIKTDIPRQTMEDIDTSQKFRLMADPKETNNLKICWMPDSQRQNIVHPSNATCPGQAVPKLYGQMPGLATSNLKTTVTSVKTPLPTLKSLLQIGVLRPGTSNLSTEVKGQIYRASLTPLGLIRSANGEVFKTPMQWLTFLQEDGIMMKRRKSYEKISYNGLSLLSFCNVPLQEDHIPDERTVDQGRRSFQSSTGQGISERTVGQGSFRIQEKNNCEETDEGQLNKFLSNCRIHLLQKADLIPCHDLPVNFWANEFADVKLPSDIWECVDSWD